MDFKIILLAQAPVYIISSLIMTKLEVKLINLRNYDVIEGDFAQQAGKIFFNSLVAMFAAWFL